ncbi:hypothetical protein D3C87_1643140 [compost metagenome]
MLLSLEFPNSQENLQTDEPFETAIDISGNHLETFSKILIPLLCILKMQFVYNYDLLDNLITVN